MVSYCGPMDVDVRGDQKVSGFYINEETGDLFMEMRTYLLMLPY